MKTLHLLGLLVLTLSSLALAQKAPPEDWLIPEGTFPLTEEPATLRIFAPSSASIDLTTAGFTKWYEAQTGVTIEWMLAPSGQDANQALNLLMASGDYPDVIMYPLTPSQQMLYGQQGILVPLNDLIEEHGTWTKRVFEEFPTIEEAVTSPDGTIYGLPEANQCYHCSMAQKMWVYQPWLDKLGLEMPETTEDFQAMLTAFKTQDPNGNGKADEIALTGAPGENIWNGQMDSFLMNSFTLNPIETDRLTLTDGRVAASYAQPEFREGLRYLRSLYKGGLIAPEAFTQSADQLLAQGLSEPVTIGAVNTALSGYVAEWNTERNAEYVTVPPLTGPDGLRTTPFVPVYGGGRFFITVAAEDPALALRFADALYIPEVEMGAIFGEEGVNWRWAEEGEVSIDGRPAIYATLPAVEGAPGWGWDQVNPSYRPNWFRLAEVRKSDLDSEVVLYEQTEKMAPYAQDPDSALPPLFFTTEQAQELADLEATITRYVEEMIARFTSGDADIESDAGWEEFQAQLSAMGLPRMLEIYQAAYDAKAD